MQCMFCNSSGRTFNIFEDYGNGRHTIKDDMIEFFGLNIEPYLEPADVVCNVCMNILENFSKLKRRLMPMIIDRADRPYDRKPIKFGKIWDMFATSQFEDEPDSLMNCPTPTPCLLKYSHSKPYHSRLESQIAQREHARSQSRTSQYYSDASTSREVSRLLNKKKRRKQKPKSKQWTRRKSQSRGARARSVASRPATTSATFVTNYIEGCPSVRSYSPSRSTVSDCSYESFYRPVTRASDKVSVKSTTPSVLRYRDDRLLNKRTRSVSRLQEQEAQRVAAEETEKYQCSFCAESFDELDRYTAHEITIHSTLALFVCHQGCSNRYITFSHLRTHYQIVHSKELLKCPMCNAEIVGMENLQKHIRQHLEYSVGCIYCDLYFLDRRLRDEHVTKAHPGPKKRVKQRIQMIVDRVDKTASVTSELTEPETPKPPYQEKQFSVRYLVQNSHPEEAEEDPNEEHRRFLRQLRGADVPSSAEDSNDSAGADDNDVKNFIPEGVVDEEETVHEVPQEWLI